MPHAPVLLTRPEAQSRSFARRIAERLGPGPVVIAPVLEIVPLPPFPDLAAWAGVVLTSPSAAELPGIAWPAGLPAFCTGARTAAIAAAQGLDARSADGALPELAALIRRTRPEGRLLHLRGTEVAGDLRALLAADGIGIDEAVVYAQRPKPPGPAAEALLAAPGPVLIPVFSPRSAAALAPYLEKSRARLLIAAISPAAAKPLPVQSAARIAVAARPDADAVLDRLADLEASLRA